MKLSVFENLVQDMEEVVFLLPNGDSVPSNFHITEVGAISKHFIDCGGVIREEIAINFQLWNSDDIDHQLNPEKILHILKLSKEKLNLGDHEIEVEYQGTTIGKYGIELQGKAFVLTNKMTDCLAKDACGIPEKQTTPLINAASDPCIHGNGCC